MRSGIADSLRSAKCDQVIFRACACRDLIGMEVVAHIGRRDAATGLRYVLRDACERLSNGVTK